MTALYAGTCLLGLDETIYVYCSAAINQPEALSTRIILDCAALRSGQPELLQPSNWNMCTNLMW